MKLRSGYAIITDPTGVREFDTFTCGHCQTVVAIKPGGSPYDAGGGCRVCDKMICPKCVNVGRCVPWEESIKRMEARDAARRSYGL